MFVRKIQPWSGGGGGNNSVPPIDVIISDSLAVTTVGSDTKVELINGFTNELTGSTLAAAAYSNNFANVTTDFDIAAPTGAVDGAVVNYRLQSSGTPVMSLDSSIVVPDAYFNIFPFAFIDDQTAYLELQFDATFFNSWYVSKFLTVTPGATGQIPITNIISSTLSVGIGVNPSGGNFADVEMLDSFTVETFTNPLQPGVYNNLAYVATEDFVIGPLLGSGNDGGVLNLRITATGDVTVSLDSSIKAPAAFGFPYSMTSADVLYITIQEDDTSLNAQYVSDFLPLTGVL